MVLRKGRKTWNQLTWKGGSISVSLTRPNCISQNSLLCPLLIRDILGLWRGEVKPTPLCSSHGLPPLCWLQQTGVFYCCSCLPRALHCLPTAPTPPRWSTSTFSRSLMDRALQEKKGVCRLVGTKLVGKYFGGGFPPIPPWLASYTLLGLTKRWSFITWLAENTNTLKKAFTV